MNEFQVVLGETTFGGRKELQVPSGLVDYGSLMYIALERAKTAREAIQVMTSLAETYGYASEGESFSIGDPNEAWILDMIGKGKGQTGAVWVAYKLPDGTISAHANQSRIRRFPRTTPTPPCSARTSSPSPGRRATSRVKTGTSASPIAMRRFPMAPCGSARPGYGASSAGPRPARTSPSTT